MGTDIAVQVRDFLKGGVIQQAVNFFSLSGDLYDQVRPAMDLAERLGLFLGQVCPGTLERIEVGLYGDLRELDVQADPVGGRERRPAGRRSPRASPSSTRCRWPRSAGIEIVESTSSADGRLREPDGAAPQDQRASDLSVAGTLFGRNHLRLVDVDGVEVDAIPQGNILLVQERRHARAWWARSARLLGAQRVNIARMGRRPQAGQRPRGDADRGGQRACRRRSLAEVRGDPRRARGARPIQLGR